MADHISPGVYIEEKNTFPNSVEVVETAIPAFIGYTFKAERDGKSLLRIPTRINSFEEYVDFFGEAFRPKFKIEAAPSPLPIRSFKLGLKDMIVNYEKNNELYFYNSIRLFYANGGGLCVVLSIGVYGEGTEQQVKASDFMATDDHPIGPLEILKNDPTPTLIVIPDIAALRAGAYPLYPNILSHCAEMENRFAIFDLKYHDETEKSDAVAEEFRTAIGTDFLSYGAVYYPWLNTVIVEPDELTFENLPANLPTLLEPEVQEPFTNYNSKLTAVETEADKLNDLKAKHHLALKSSSPYYCTILDQARNLFNTLPPSAAIAGIYTMVDHIRGVWKSPANYALNKVNSPIINISDAEQDQFNIDVSGKSINVIRSFHNRGTLVWGARTMDGNNQDWKYICVRRTLIMIEQSIKTATKAYVFEPNDANTWTAIRGMISNFLINLWRQGALVGAVPQQAFDVQIGLGSTMTSTDILEDRMIIMIEVAMIRPAEFIIIRFQQQQQQP
ncbi:MAG: phage tail sheath C-terminal domain-containing protein [Candidatus Pedobacter colombiensis]|uniref:Phage tail sheath C-terminal domain-containing protein n=1 Tax=Candidatus Pedobacter colombiensis TaxID=3121371 RepID=A0AAJ6B8Q1_9SPHI|nr:phage tail sheath C-terminal domain-containing protein [Pedobacter sp.]WEK20731.1 MAG: phage tail sheath C-terminal domain-containing protein [Pedobacter sp.]